MGLATIIAVVLIILSLTGVVSGLLWVIVSLILFDCLLLLFGFFVGYQLINRNKKRIKSRRWLD